jgi:hypothetical protein
VFSDEAHHTYGQSMDSELKKVRKTVDYLAANTNVLCVVAVCLPNGAPAKLAIYFPQTNDLKELKPVIDRALVEVGESPALCLVNTSDDTRCLRQVPGNAAKARVYLSKDNFNVLDRQLQETYGETIAALNHAAQESRRTHIVLRRLDIPPLSVTRVLRTVSRKEGGARALSLTRPSSGTDGISRTTFTLGQSAATYSVLQQVGAGVTVESTPETIDAYTGGPGGEPRQRGGNLLYRRIDRSEQDRVFCRV